MAEQISFNTRLGKEIVNLRKSKGYSQKEFAKLCGLTSVSMNKIEKGGQKPSDESMRKICDILDIPVSFLYFLSIKTEDFQDEKKKDLFQKYRPVLKSIIDQLLNNPSANTSL
jgi:transcriptional regulator with XRE-family HTH domain